MGFLKKDQKGRGEAAEDASVEVHRRCHAEALLSILFSAWMGTLGTFQDADQADMEKQ